MKTWEQKLAKRRRQNEWKREQQFKRAEMRPLRDAVNLALRRAKIPHSVTTYSQIVKGWPTSTSEGWETESVYWADPKYIKIKLNAHSSSFSNYSHEREKELADIAEKALSGFSFVRDGNGFQVYAEAK